MFTSRDRLSRWSRSRPGWKRRLRGPMKCSIARWDRSSSMACAFATAGRTACFRSPTLLRSRATWARLKLRCGWARIDFTNTFERLDSGSKPGSKFPVERWSKVSIGAISMGQEIGISPLQLGSLISTIANDGVHVPPRIVAGTIAPQNTPQTIVFQPAEGPRVISSLTAAEMRQMLQGVVLHGTGRKALLEGYSSAGKTGTAQKVDPATGTYSKTKYVASFAGFAPINDPQIAVV